MYVDKFIFETDFLHGHGLHYLRNVPNHVGSPDILAHAWHGMLQTKGKQILHSLSLSMWRAPLSTTLQVKVKFE